MEMLSVSDISAEISDQGFYSESGQSRQKVQEGRAGYQNVKLALEDKSPGNQFCFMGHLGGQHDTVNMWVTFTFLPAN